MKQLLVSVCLLAVLCTCPTALAQSFAPPSDQRNLGLMVSSIQQVIQTSKADRIRWDYDQPMYVDGVLMDGASFRSALESILGASEYRVENYSVAHPVYENAFGPFRDFQLIDPQLTIDGDSCTVTCTFKLFLTGEKEAAGFLKFYRIVNHYWRLDTLNGLMPLLQGEALFKGPGSLVPASKKKGK